MSQRDSEFWTRARRARDKLIDRFIHHPDVIGIDIGYPPEWDEKDEEIVLRLHVRERWMTAMPDQRVAFPEQVDDIPVIVMLGKYRLEKTSSERLPERDALAYFQYLGKTGIAVIGPQTRKVYRFGSPGAIVGVDPRDQRALAAVSVLRQVRKPTNGAEEF